MMATESSDAAIKKPFPYVTIGKLVVSSVVFGLACRCIFNAFKHNQDSDYSDIFYRFYKGYITKYLAFGDSQQIPHLPLVAASGAALVLSGQSAINAIQELCEN